MIGGENFVPLAQDPVTSATSRLNDWHGTGDRDMIAAHASFISPLSSSPVGAFQRTWQRHRLSQRRLSNLSGRHVGRFRCRHGAGGQDLCAQGVSVSRRRRSRVANHRRDGPRDHAAAQFQQGGPSAPVSGTGTEDSPFKFDSLNIKVVNMSLGGPTLFAGRDIEDQLTLDDARGRDHPRHVGRERRLCGDDGRQPGTGIGSLTTGASSTPAHERILRDIQFRPPGRNRALYRPFNQVQTAYFSSRGPTADGRFDPDLSANGFASYVNVFAAVVNGRIVVVRRPGRHRPQCVRVANSVRLGDVVRVAHRCRRRGPSQAERCPARRRCRHAMR